jgi:hypothetical protein
VVFGLPALTARDANSDALLDMFDFTAPAPAGAADRAGRGDGRLPAVLRNDSLGTRIHPVVASLREPRRAFHFTESEASKSATQDVGDRDLLRLLYRRDGVHRRPVHDRGSFSGCSMLTLRATPFKVLLPWIC